MRRMALIAAAAGLALGGCSATRDKAAAEAGVARFHQMMDAGRYHDIYAGAGPEFRRTGTEAEEIRTLQLIHDRLGAFRDSQQSSWNVNFGTGGNVVNLTYNARFASASGTENFVFRVDGDTAQLAGYHVNSQALLGSGEPAAAAPAKPSGEPAPQSTVRLAPPEPAEPGGGK